MQMLRHNPEKRGGGKAWAALLVGVGIYDTLGDETLTNAFARGREHDSPIVRAATVGGLALVAAHLMDRIPSEYDPIDRLANGLGRVADRVGEWSVPEVRLP